MEAHNGLTARLVQEAGFDAIWASGLAISAALGVRDSNEASWTQVLDVVEFMTDATDVPILVDGDTGYGNFNNARRLIRKLEQRGVAGVAMEDKLFPKKNSFVGEGQPLIAIDEFCGKLLAARDARTDPDFVIIARTEAFIAGWGLDEALLRATAYADSGADAVLVHSKRSDAKEVLEFMDAWDRETPVVVVPTTYPSVPIERLEAAGVTNFIFANQTLRAMIPAAQACLRALRRTRALASVEDTIAPLQEIFRLQDLDELRGAEARYLPERARPRARALLLAATQGDFGPLVAERPKCMLNMDGRPVLSWQLDALRRQGVRDVAAVLGFRKDVVDMPGLSTFENDEHAETGEVFSLYQACSFLEGPVLILYGDVLLEDTILALALSNPADIVVAADAAFRIKKRTDPKRDLVISEGARRPLEDGGCRLLEIGPGVDWDQASGEFVGALSLSSGGTARLLERLQRLANESRAELRTMNLSDLLGTMVAEGEAIHVVHTYGHWRDLDGLSDLELASVPGGPT